MNPDIIEITSLDQSGVNVFSQLTEAQLRNRAEQDKGIFIAESPKVINVALDQGYQPTALLCERRHIEGDAKTLIARCGNIPVYTGSRELLGELTGYTLTRGVLCAMRRPAPLPLEDVCRNARRVVVIDGVVDTTNIGAIFRSAAALGIDAVLLTRNSCDPLNRRAVRVSMGSVFLVPWTWIDDPVDDCDGPYRRLRLAGRPAAEAGRALGAHHGHRGRRTAPLHYRKNKLRGANSNVAPRRFTQRCSSCCRRFLGTENQRLRSFFSASIFVSAAFEQRS